MKKYARVKLRRKIHLWVRPKRDIKAYQFVRNIVLRNYEGICVYCGSEATQVDHIIANCYGGTDTTDNLVASCGRCNRLKGCRDYDNFCEEQPWLLSKKEQNKYRRKYRFPDGRRISFLINRNRGLNVYGQKIDIKQYSKCRHGKFGKFCVACRYH